MAKKRAKKPERKARKRRAFRLIPITVTMLALLFIIKINDVYLNSQQLKDLYSVRDASAADDQKSDAPASGDSAAKDAPASKDTAPAAKDAAAPTPASADAAKTDAAAPASGDAPKADAAGATDAKPASADAAAPSSADAADPDKDKAKTTGYKKDKPIPGVNRTYGAARSNLSDIDAVKAKENTPLFTQNEIDLLQNLAKRRDELDQRERDLDMKSKVLEASEKRIDDKISEMKTLQAELTKVVAQYNDKQDTQIKSLVKVYENMKPIDAAAIFNEMDMPILLEVIDKMSERKVAPVLAAMDPKKARDVTEELAEMRRSMSKAAGIGK